MARSRRPRSSAGIGCPDSAPDAVERPEHPPGTVALPLPVVGRSRAVEPVARLEAAIGAAGRRRRSRASRQASSGVAAHRRRRRRRRRSPAATRRPTARRGRPRPRRSGCVRPCRSSKRLLDDAARCACEPGTVPATEPRCRSQRRCRSAGCTGTPCELRVGARPSAELCASQPRCAGLGSGSARSAPSGDCRRHGEPPPPHDRGSDGPQDPPSSGVQCDSVAAFSQYRARAMVPRRMHPLPWTSPAARP